MPGRWLHGECLHVLFMLLPRRLSPEETPPPLLLPRRSFYNASQAFVHSSVLLSCALPPDLPPQKSACSACTILACPFQQFTLAPALCTKYAGHVWFLMLVCWQLVAAGCWAMQSQLGKHVCSRLSGVCTMRCCCRQARQASLQEEEGAVAAAADKQQDVRSEAAAAAVASTATEDAGGEGREAVAAEPAGSQPDNQATDGDVVAVKGAAFHCLHPGA